MLKQLIIFFLIFSCLVLFSSCSLLDPDRLRGRINHVTNELFSQATITMPVLVTSTPTPTPTKIPSATPIPTDTLTPSPTPKPLVFYSSPTFEVLETQTLPISLKDAIKGVTDVTIPDDTVLRPGQLFIKSWRMTNNGEKTWKDGTKLMMDTTFDTDMPKVVKAVFIKENDWIDFTPGGWGSRVYNVGKGTEADLAVILMAPYQPGSYQIQFRLVTTDGEIIPTQFWMRFFVVSPTATPTPEPPTATPVLPSATPRSGVGTPLAVNIDVTPEPEAESYDWDGHWMVREPFITDQIVPANAWFDQNGEEMTGFIYDSTGNPIIVKGVLSEKGRTFTGEMFYPWQLKTTAVTWRMQFSHDQFHAVTSLGTLTDFAVCGGRNGANLPDSCALPSEE